MRRIAFFLTFITSCAFAQGVSPSFQIGFGTHTDHIWGLTHEFDSIKIGGQTSRGSNRLSFHFYYNLPLRPSLNFEFGIKAYNIIYGYTMAQKRPPFGYIHKVGYLSSKTLNIPVNLGQLVNSFT